LPVKKSETLKKSENPPTIAPAPKETAVILGVKIYSDGTLLRGADGRIYIVRGQIKKYIANLTELARYRGREIISASEEELSAYQARGHWDGELIRQQGDARIYVIVSGKKQHIRTLAELRARYAGLEIFNLPAEEIALYGD
jgi:hypothetical protein